PALGARVVVPLGSRSVTGVVVERDVPLDGVDEAAIKSVRQVLDAEPFLPADIVSLARWTAEYYAAGPGETILAVLPPQTRGERADAHKTRRIAAITAAGMESAASVAGGRRREALALLAGAPLGLSTADLAARGIGADTVARLARQGLVALRHERVER